MKVRILLILILALTAALRISTFSIPFERDEGEYTYAGQLMLEGIPPYDIACNMKLPGTYAAHAINMAIFGETIKGVHAGLMVWNLGAIVLMFFLGRRLFGDTGGLVAAASYAWLSVGPSVMGTASHATQYVAPCAIAGLLLLLRSERSDGLSLPFWGGILMGLGFLMKQHGMFFGFFGGLYLIWIDHKRIGVMIRKLMLFSAGAVLPFGLTCLILWRAGVFPRFWFWTFTYARAYTSETSLGVGLQRFTDGFLSVAEDTPALFALALAGVALLWLKRKEVRLAIFCTGFLAFSLLAMSPGLYFREHYFVLMLPAVSLLAAASVVFAPAKIRRPWPAIVFVLAIAASVIQQNEFFFRSTPIEQAHDVWGDNPFPEVIPISDYIRSHSTPQMKIAVMGSEPEIYFYTHRHSATGILYAYPLMERQPYAEQMQEEMMRDIVTKRPEYIVWVNHPVSWGKREGSITTILDWWKTYWPDKYDVVGLADMMEDRTEYRWDAAAANYHVQSEEYLQILKRRTASATP